MRFAEKLTVLIDRAGTNQSKLGRLTGFGQTSISDMTKGRRRPYMDQGLVLARALGVPLDYLADDAQDEPPAPLLSEDDRVVLELFHALGLDRREAMRRLATPTDAGGTVTHTVITQKEAKESIPSRAGQGPKARTG